MTVYGPSYASTLSLGESRTSNPSLCWMEAANPSRVGRHGQPQLDPRGVGHVKAHPVVDDGMAHGLSGDVEPLPLLPDHDRLGREAVQDDGRRRLLRDLLRRALDGGLRRDGAAVGILKPPGFAGRRVVCARVVIGYNMGGVALPYIGNSAGARPTAARRSLRLLRTLGGRSSRAPLAARWQPNRHAGR